MLPCMDGRFTQFFLPSFLSSVCSAASENEIPHRHNTSTSILTTRGYVSQMKTLDPDYLAPAQFFKLAKGSGEFAFACVCVEFRFHIACVTFVLGALVKTRRKSFCESADKFIKF